MSNGELKHRIFVGGGFASPVPDTPSFILQQSGDKILTQNNNRLIQENYGG